MVPLPEKIRIELKRHRKNQAQTKPLIGEMYEDEGFVFTWQDGRMVTVTLDTYSHVEPELKERSAEKINDFLERKNLPLDGKG